MNEADSSVEPEVKTRLDILFVKILKLYSFFLNQFYCFETLEISSFKNWCFVGLKQLQYINLLRSFLFTNSRLLITEVR
jgi:replication initiation and membrane attachment protein DnaB